jgi:hypothetical protein
MNFVEVEVYATWNLARTEATSGSRKDSRSPPSFSEEVPPADRKVTSATPKNPKIVRRASFASC